MMQQGRKELTCGEGGRGGRGREEGAIEQERAGQERRQAWPRGPGPHCLLYHRAHGRTVHEPRRNGEAFRGEEEQSRIRESYGGRYEEEEEAI
jgi:hypothetical protein